MKHIYHFRNLYCNIHIATLSSDARHSLSSSSTSRSCPPWPPPEAPPAASAAYPWCGTATRAGEVRGSSGSVPYRVRPTQHPPGAAPMAAARSASGGWHGGSCRGAAADAARGGERGGGQGPGPHDPQIYTRNLNFD